MVLRRIKPRFLAMFLTLVGAGLLTTAAALVAVPLGFAVAGAASVLIGLFLVDVEGVHESSPARPKRPPT